jgi:hypothetical protein
MSFESLTDGRIAQLLEMPKRVTNPKAREVPDANHFRRDFTVQSEDGTQEFVLFTRQNKTITENFSCGLRWMPPGSEDLMLARYNGPSHSHPNRLEGDRIDHLPHIHRATERYLQANLKSEGFAETTERYKTLSGALHELVNDLHISGLETKPDHPELFQ